MLDGAHRQHDTAKGLGMIQPVGQPAKKSRMVRIVRPILGIVTIVALILEASLATGDASIASDGEASAIQIIQLWTPHLYYVMLIIGISIACYIWTRAYD